MAKKIVCSPTHLFHYMFNPDQDALDSFLQNGIRPLSDFPESERWKQLEEHMPGFYEDLYKMMAEPLLQKPYPNSGIFITPIDFRLLPGTYLNDKPRFRIPFERIDPEMTVITYVLDDERVVLPFAFENLENIVSLWDEELVRRWFAVDKTKVFFYVPQVASYQGQIMVFQEDFETD
jgi:hypothetical protein